MNLAEAAKQACEQPSLLDALGWICEWDADRAIKHRLHAIGYPLGHLGYTCFTLCLQEVLREWARKMGGREGSYGIEINIELPARPEDNPPPREWGPNAQEETALQRLSRLEGKVKQLEKVHPDLNALASKVDKNHEEVKRLRDLVNEKLPGLAGVREDCKRTHATGKGDVEGIRRLVDACATRLELNSIKDRLENHKHPVIYKEEG